MKESKYIINSNEWIEKIICKNDDQLVYHYTSIDGLKGIVDNSKLRFTDRLYMNDASEGVYTFELLEKHYKEIFPNKIVESFEGEIEKTIQECKNQYFDSNPFSIYQVSFSLNKDSLPLWNYYTKGSNIEGYNILFNSKKLAESISYYFQSEHSCNPNIYGGKVIYKIDNQIELLKDYMNSVYQSIIADNSAKLNKETITNYTFYNRTYSIIDRLMLIGTFFKNPLFESEQEYRIFLNPYDYQGKLYKIENEEVQRRFSCRNGLFIPYIDLKFDLNTIIGITSSPTIGSKDKMDSLKKYLDIRVENNTIQLFDSEIPVRF